VLVDEHNQIVIVGYNGPPAGWRAPLVNVDDGTSLGTRPLAPFETCGSFCERAKTGGSLSYDDCVSSHSETNALIHADAARLRNGSAYITSCPCYSCAKILANSGIRRVVCRIGEVDKDRDPQRSLDFLMDASVHVEVVS
jgi:deoxycytidylate deaminase